MQFAANSSSGSGLLTFLPIILLFAAMYFLMIRPQTKRRREAAQMQSQLGPGDEVQTVGGLFATVAAVDDDVITLEVSPGVTMRYTRGAIARVITHVETDDSADDNEDAQKAV